MMVVRSNQVKRSILFSVALLLAGTLAQAQFHEFKLNLGVPAMLYYSGDGLISYGAMYEYGINPDLGINTNAQMSFYSLDARDNGLSTWTFTADLRYYYFEWNGGDGLFLSIYSKYRSLKHENWWPTIDANGNSSTEDYSSGAIAFGLAVGRKGSCRPFGRGMLWVLEAISSISEANARTILMSAWRDFSMRNILNSQWTRALDSPLATDSKG